MMWAQTKDLLLTTLWRAQGHRRRDFPIRKVNQKLSTVVAGGTKGERGLETMKKHQISPAWVPDKEPLTPGRPRRRGGEIEIRRSSVESRLVVLRGNRLRERARR